MTTPTIAQVLTDFKAGTYTLAQAEALIGKHIAAAVDLSTFAGLAMQSLMEDRKFITDAKNLGQDCNEAVAAAAFAQARAMMNARI